MQWRGGYKGSAGEWSIQRDGQLIPFLPLSEEFWHQMRWGFTDTEAEMVNCCITPLLFPLGVVFLSLSPLRGASSCSISLTLRRARISSRCFTMSGKDGRSLGSIWEEGGKRGVHDITITMLITWHNNNLIHKTTVGASTSIWTLLNKWLIKGMWLNCFMALSILYSWLAVYSADRKDFLIRMYSKEIEHYADVRWT